MLSHAACIARVLVCAHMCTHADATQSVLLVCMCVCMHACDRVRTQDSFVPQTSPAAHAVLVPGPRVACAHTYAWPHPITHLLLASQAPGLGGRSPVWVLGEHTDERQTCLRTCLHTQAQSQCSTHSDADRPPLPQPHTWMEGVPSLKASKALCADVGQSPLLSVSIVLLAPACRLLLGSSSVGVSCVRGGVWRGSAESF